MGKGLRNRADGMGRLCLPPGFRFHPTDEEIVSYYLKRKVCGRQIEFEVIAEIDLYKFEPWDLPEISCLQSTDLEWYFFCPRDRKYLNSSRANRATEAGYWKATGKDRSVYSGARKLGMKKTLVFYKGRAPRGERTNWVMHEYRLDDQECERMKIPHNGFVLCRVFKKSGPGPRSTERYGGPFMEDDWKLLPAVGGEREQMEGGSGDSDSRESPATSNNISMKSNVFVRLGGRFKSKSLGKALDNFMDKSPAKTSHSVDYAVENSQENCEVKVDRVFSPYTEGVTSDSGQVDGS